jgi:hypothetical protein
VPETAAAKVAAAEMPSTEMSAAKVAAAEMAASEATEMTEPPEVTTAEMTAAADSTKMAAPAETAEMAAAAETTEMTADSTVPKGESFASHARHHTRRERYFEAEPERHRRCENFRHPTSHGVLLPPAEL